MNKMLEYPEIKTLLNAYQDWTPSTAIYTDDVAETYLVNGLTAEIFEYADANTEESFGELGDNFWFMSQIGNLFGFRLGDVLAYGAVPNLDNPFTEFYSAYAKSYRKSLPREEMIEKIRVPFYKVLRSLIDMCEDYEGNVTAVLMYNQAKLESRQERGVLEGDGGSR